MIDYQQFIKASKETLNSAVSKENFDTGLKKTILWFLKNEWWWQAIIDGSYKKNNDEIY